VLVAVRSGNADLAALSHQVARFAAGVAEAQAAYAPQVYLTGMGDLSGSTGRSGASGYGVGIVIGLPLVDGGERRARVDESRAMLREAQERLRQRTLEVERDARSRWEQARAAGENAALALAAQTEAEEVLRISTLRYETGKGIYLEVLDAVANLTRARLSRIRALADYNSAVAELWAAMGRQSPGSNQSFPHE